jgi:tetratricopeptide (TPR) repeat protein
MRNILQHARVRWWHFVADRRGKRRDCAAALKLLQRIIETNPRDAGALVRAGFCLSELSQHEEALPFFERALQVSPSYAEAHAYLSLAYRALGRNQEAFDSLNRAFRMKPNLADREYWLHQLGLICGALNRWEPALAAFTDVTKLDAKHADGWHGVGWANFHLDRFPEALTAYECAARLNSESAAVQCELGRCYLETGQTVEGLQHLQRSVTVDPADAAVVTQFEELK